MSTFEPIESQALDAVAGGAPRSLSKLIAKATSLFAAKAPAAATADKVVAERLADGRISAGIEGSNARFIGSPDLMRRMGIEVPH